MAAAFAGIEHFLLVSTYATRRAGFALSSPFQTRLQTRRQSSTCTATRNVYTSPATGKRYIATIGLEIHAQLNAQTKLFSNSLAAVEGPPNTNVTVFDAAIPGAMPALRTAIAFEADINPASSFDRKHYFYQDIPLGYQITQKNSPIATGGRVTLQQGHDGLPYPLSVPLVQLQIEQDTARSYTLSSPSFSQFRHYALVGIDLNRAGVGLVEIVSEPALRSGAEAAAFVRKLVSVVEHIGSVRPGGMEGGVVRVDVNVSVVPDGADLGSGTRVEVKNLNSVRSISKAADYEVARHVGLLEGDGTLQRETRSWDEVKEVTVPNRVKEENEDYRYMPEGDLPILRVDAELIEQLRASLPPLPDKIRTDLLERHGPNGLTKETAAMLFGEPGAVVYFEALVASLYARRDAARSKELDVRDPANWLVQTLFGVLHTEGVLVADAETKGLGPRVLAELVHLTETGVVSQLSAKYVLSDLATGDTRTPTQIATDKGYIQISSEDALLPLVRRVILENAERAEQVRGGKHGLIGWFVGEIRRQSGAKADPVVLRRLVETEIGVENGAPGKAKGKQQKE